VVLNAGGVRRKGERAKEKGCPPKGASLSNNAVLVTAARLRFGMNAKGPVRAAARDGWR